MNRDAPFWRLVVAVGVAGGATGAAYLAVLHLMTEVLGPEHRSSAAHVAVLVAVGVAIGALVRWLGDPGDVELLVDDIHVSGGRRDIRNLRTLLPVSLLGIAAGSAVGPEAPLVQTTGSIGTLVAHRQGLGIDAVRVLTITGMAAAFTVLFGAPLGGAVFALEILHRRGLEYYEALFPALLGALCGFGVFLVVRRAGIEPVWDFAPVGDLSAVHLLVGVAAGVAGAAVAVAFTWVVALQRRLHSLVPVVARPAVGGLILGLLALASPYALTFGEEQIDVLATGGLAVGTLLLAVLCKFLAASTMAATGWRGGFIIPLFFLGAGLAAVAHEVLGVDLTVAMLATMAACNVGVTKTPVGSTLVVTGMAGARLLPTTLLASVVALVLTRRFALIESQREREGVLGVL
jgi:H+/Cl- antiporter ClcA